MAAPVHYRVSKAKGLFLYLIAGIADVIQLLFKLLWFTGVLAILSEAVGWVVSIGAIFAISAILLSSGVRPMKGWRGQTRSILTILIEGMPFLNLVPTLTLWTFLTIRQSRKEDRERAEQSARMEAQAAALAQMRASRRRRAP